jgi:hypothetical protein
MAMLERRSAFSPDAAIPAGVLQEGGAAFLREQDGSA